MRQPGTRYTRFNVSADGECVAVSDQPIRAIASARLRHLAAQTVILLARGEAGRAT